MAKQARKSAAKSGAKKAPAKGRVAEATGSAAGGQQAKAAPKDQRRANTAPDASAPSPGPTSKQIEEAMSKAVLKAMSDGNQNPADHRRLMLEARDKLMGRK